MIVILQEWLTNNRPLIYFIYGQVFFIGGLGIILQSRQFSRLQLAQSLPWLASFCIIHSFNEWGDLFIPIQELTTPTLLITLLKVLQLFLLSSSYACLFMFGIGLLRPMVKHWNRLRWIPLIVYLLWLIGPFWYGLISPLPIEIWVNSANAICRYTMGFTGSAVSAYALFRYSNETESFDHLPTIRRHLRLAALALAFYAVFSGLIVPPAPFFPADVVNTSSFSQFFIFPVLIFRSFSGLLLSIAMIRALVIFELETNQLIEAMEKNLVITAERERIGRDLHDGALQLVYAAGLQAGAIRKHTHGRQAENLDKLIETLNTAINELRVFLSVVKPAETNADLKNALQTVIKETLRASELNIIFNPSQDLFLPPDQVSNLAAVVREALSNVLRHAHASQVTISYFIINDQINLNITDNGVGLPKLIDAGYGLRNIRDRVHLLGGELSFTSPKGGGTCICLKLPIEGNSAND